MSDASSPGRLKRCRMTDHEEFTLFPDLGLPSLKDEVFFVELCAGSGILSSTARNYGYSVFPVDHGHNRHKSFTKIFSLDLTDNKAWAVLDWLRDATTVVAWHLGLPCGTCSRAREIPLEDGSQGPPPLRNEQYPLGIPGMSSQDSLKVSQANQLYERACQFVLQLLFLCHVITIENPTDSWLWHLPYFEMLYKYCFFVNFHACMFGGARKKRTSFLTNETRFQGLEKFCDNSHEHAPWGRDEFGNFNTAHEAQYPQGLCDAYCKILLDIRKPNEVNTSVEPVDDNDQDSPDPTRYRAHVQPRGRKVRPLVPEFVNVI